MPIKSTKDPLLINFVEFHEPACDCAPTLITKRHHGTTGGGSDDDVGGAVLFLMSLVKAVVSEPVTPNK